MSAGIDTTFLCVRCGRPLDMRDLACPGCGALVHRDRLEQIAAEAQRLEPVDRAAALSLWQQCLPLLPADSQQYQIIASRCAALACSAEVSSPEASRSSESSRPRQDSWTLAVFKTVGSMAVSAALYSILPGGWRFAVGFVLLILVHEMGHVLANRYYGLHASPPIFIPFLGAIINLRQPPPNAKVEAVVGIAGPLAGSLATLVCLVWYGQTQSPLAEELAYWGFLLNLFNMLPVPPLDGGRVAAAMSPWLWVAGLAGMGGLIYVNYRQNVDFSMLLLILIFALPRIITTLTRGDQRRGPYYQISRRATWTISTAYLCLLAFLATGYFGHQRIAQYLTHWL